MPRADGSLTTTERGLGWKDHQKPRKALLPAWLGTPCSCSRCGKHRGLCGTVLTRENAEFDHILARALGGTRAERFLCRSCNRSRGAILGNRIRAAGRRRRRAILANPSRQW